MTPLIVWSPLRQRWYLVTRYTAKQVKPDGPRYLKASRKVDVTDQMTRILKACGATRKLPRGLQIVLPKDAA